VSAGLRAAKRIPPADPKGYPEGISLKPRHGRRDHGARDRSNGARYPFGVTAASLPIVSREL